MYTIEEFEKAIDALEIYVEKKEVKVRNGKVREFVGYVSNNRLVWNAFGECLKGRTRVKELDVKFG